MLFHLFPWCCACCAAVVSVVADDIEIRSDSAWHATVIVDELMQLMKMQIVSMIWCGEDDDDEG